METQVSSDPHSLEISRLQLKVRAQESALQKLLKEKEEAIRGQEEAEQAVRLLQHEAEIREKVFAKIREDYEREIATLKSIKQQLEIQLGTYNDSGSEHSTDANTDHDGAVVPSEQLPFIASLPQLSSEEAISSLSKWRGMEDTIQLLRSVEKQHSGNVCWKTGAPWTGKWKYVINLYISAPPDALDLTNSIIKETVERLEEVCSNSACFLSTIIMGAPDVSNIFTEDQVQSLACHAVESADIFLCVLKDESTRLTKMEVETGFLNSPNTRPCVFILLPCQQSSGEVNRLCERIKKMRQSGNVLINECKKGIQNLQSWLSTELLNILKQFEVYEAPSQSGLHVTDLIAYQQDRYREYEQVEILHGLLADAPNLLIGVDEVFAELDDYLNEDGSLSSLLLAGPAGNGKSTILAKWIEQLRVDGVFVMYHFISGRCFSNSEPSLILRRFLQKLKYYCKEEDSRPVQPFTLESEFISAMQRATITLAGSDSRVVMVIDSADLMTDVSKQMSWLCKPLPNNVRVVISSRDDRCPDCWRALPSVTFPTSTSNDIRDIVNGVADKQPSVIKISEDQLAMLAIQAPEYPLWSVLAVKNIARSSTIESLDDYIDELESYQEVSDMLVHMMDSLLSEFPNCDRIIESIMKLLFSARNGLLLSEICSILGLSAGVVLAILTELKLRMIVTGNSVYSLSNEEVQDSVLLLYPDSEYLQKWSSPLLAYFSTMTGNTTVLSRSMMELPWLLKRAEMRHELSLLVHSVDFLLITCSSGCYEELLDYWQCLGGELSHHIDHYFRALLLIQEAQVEESVDSEVASSFQIVGKLLAQMGFYQQGLAHLQHALEILQSSSGVEDGQCGSVLYELGLLHLLAGQLESSANFYIQAIESLDTCDKENYKFHIKVLKDLVMVYKEKGEKENAEEVYGQILAIEEGNFGAQVEASEILRQRVKKLEELSADPSSSPQLPVHLNELGVILAVYGDVDAAEEKFLHCLEYSESIGAEKSQMTHVLMNLGRFYSEKKRYDLAIPLIENVYDIFMENPQSQLSDTIEVTEKLALLHREQNNLERAEFLLRQLLELKIEELGEDHLEVAKVLNNLAVMCCIKEDFSQGLPHYDRAIKIYTNQLGYSHPVTQAAINNKLLTLANVQENENT